MLEAVLAGLASAHRDGLVHRDVKPENVLISRTGAVKVADFGLVTAAAQAAHTGAATATGAIMGTPAYLAPEQVASGAADARSDVYAAGILLYEMLTGAPPFSGDTPLAVAYQHVNSEVPPPSARTPGIPPAVDDLVALATRRDPDARPLDAGDLALAVRRVRAELGVAVTPVPVPPPRQLADGATRAMNGAAGAGVSAGRWGTRQFTQAPYPPGAPAGAPPGALAGPPAGPGPAHGGHRRPLAEPPPRRRRGRRAFAIWLAVVIVLGVIIAASAWWLGAGQNTEVPSVVGLDRTSAERVLTEAGLVPAVTERNDDTVPADTVIATDPAPAVQLPRGSEVTVTISTGQPLVPVIAEGAEVAEAERLIRDAGLTPVVSGAYEFSSTVPAGDVLRTDPPAGTRLPSNSPVQLMLSAGDEPDRIPPGLGRSWRSSASGTGPAPAPAAMAGTAATTAATTAGTAAGEAAGTAATTASTPAADHGVISRAASRRPGTPAPATAGCSAAGRRRSRSGRTGRRRRCPARRRGTR